MSDYNKVRDIRVGLEIFERHGGTHCSSEHDEFGSGPATGKEITDAERATLEQHGWFFDEANETWMIFT